MARIRANNTSGGGGVKSKTLTTSATSTEYPINTELSSVSKFVMWATDEVSTYDLMSFCSWDSDSPNVYQSGAGAENNVGSAVRNLTIGTQSTVTTNKERLMIVMDVTGGTVTVKTPTVGVWANLTWTWIAMQ